VENTQLLLTFYIKLRIKYHVSDLGFLVEKMAENLLCKLKLKPYGVVQLES